MGNPNLLPYETIVRATSGEPETVNEVLRHYSKRIQIAAIENGHIDRDTQDIMIKKLAFTLSVVFIILTFIGAGYVLFNGGKVNAGYACIPMVFALISISVYRKYK